MKALPATGLAVFLAATSVAATIPSGHLERYDGAYPLPESEISSLATVVSTPFAVSYQVNVNSFGSNYVGDAANEPSFCVDPNDANRMAAGWRQFNSVANSFRQAGWAYTTNGGLSWIRGGVLETNVFRSDPVLGADANGYFYYLSLTPSPFACDLWRSTNGGAGWQRIGSAVGGDKAWMVVDQTTGPGPANVYQAWSIVDNVYSNRVFSHSRDSGLGWSDPQALPGTPYWSTLDVGAGGELYVLGWNGSGFWLNRSTNAAKAGLVHFDLTTQVNLGGEMGYGYGVNPEGLLGQPYIAVDRSAGPTRSNLYGLCSVTGTGNPINVMFTRSTNGGVSWSTPRRLNDDSVAQNAWHWFGTLSVSPLGRVDACWNDTRHSANNSTSELYYTYSLDGGLNWAPNRAISPPFNHSLGYPTQQKMGDYISMISLADAACIVYTATFNGEEDVYFTRVEQPIVLTATAVLAGIDISWDAIPGRTYCVQGIADPGLGWAAETNVFCGPATNMVMHWQVGLAGGQQFYRVVKDRN